MRITGPLYDAEYGSEQARFQSSSAAGGPLADEHDDPPDPIDDLIEEAKAYIQSWLDSAREVTHRVLDFVFDRRHGRISVLSACNPIRILKSRTRCAIAVGGYLGWNHLGNAPPVTDPVLRDNLPSNPGERFNYTADVVAPCAGGRCGPYTPPGPEPPAQPLAFQIAVGTLEFAVGEELFNVRLPEATGGVPPIQYSLWPEIDGLLFDVMTRRWTGTPQFVGTHNMTYTATDSAEPTRGTVSLKFTLIINPDSGPLQPLAFPTQLGTQYFTVGQEVDVTLPEATGGVPPIRYSLSPSMPGLTFDRYARRVIGRPTTAGTWAMTYTASTYIGPEELDNLVWVDMNFTVIVSDADSPAEPPLEFVGTMGDLTAVVGRPIERTLLPAPRGGTRPYKHQISGRKIPPGLEFRYSDPSGPRYLQGTITEAGVYPLIYRVTDAKGERVELRFTITVTEPDEPEGPTCPPESPLPCYCEDGTFEGCGVLCGVCKTANQSPREDSPLYGVFGVEW